MFPEDDIRIASSNTIEVLMEDDFKLTVNDTVYLVNTPRQERLTKVIFKGIFPRVINTLEMLTQNRIKHKLRSFLFNLILPVLLFLSFC